MHSERSAGAPLRVCILALPSMSAASVFCAHDDLLSVGSLETQLTTGRAVGRLFNVRIVATEVTPVLGSGAVAIQPQKSIAEVDWCDIVFIPALVPDLVWMDGCRQKQPPFSRDMIDWIRRQFDGGASVVSLCNGSYVLAETGLLNGLPATTHWAMADHFQSCYPEIRVDARQSLVTTGDGGRLILAGTGTYHADLMLYIIQRYCGLEAAHSFARISGKFWAGDSQNLYARLIERGNLHDSTVRDGQIWLSKNRDSADPVKGAAAHLKIAPRTFSRRFKDATGMTPLAYVQKLRVESARRLLEASSLPVSEIAAQVGYGDVSHFSHVFQREVGLSPGLYRKRFKLPPPSPHTAEKTDLLANSPMN